MENEVVFSEITALLESMGFKEELEIIEARQGAASRFNVRIRNAAEVEDPERSRASSTNILIGEYGGNLAALEHILKKIMKKKYGEVEKFTLDINDYRLKRLEELKQDVKSAAREVRLHLKNVPLRPMSSFERRIVHLLLAEYPDITTESIGQEPKRRVVIKPYP